MIAALRKELLLQWRTRAQAVAVFVFGATALLLFSFAIGPNAAALREYAAGFLWLALLLSSRVALAGVPASLVTSTVGAAGRWAAWERRRRR